MSVTRISESQLFSGLTERAGPLQAQIRDLQEQVASGRRLNSPEQDPLGAARVVRGQTAIASLGQYDESSRFGSDVLGAQDDALGDAYNLLVRAEEIATQQSSSLLTPTERAAAGEEVHGILQSLTELGNRDLAGRRLFGGLALDAAAPFTDPDSPGYDAATAFTGSTFQVDTKVGGSAGDRVRITTRGDQVFTDALVGIQNLETALATNGNVSGTLAGLAQGRATLSDERASVGARQAQLIQRSAQVAAQTNDEQSVIGRIRDADLVSVISQLTQAQTALQALLAAGSQIARSSLSDLIPL